jgi:Na+-transporting methylmalonyl-CoA/oxaloacetate decarboxylase gamma subunit
MQNAESILVIIVSSFLTLFLITLIVLMVFVIKLIKQLKRIAEKAEHAVETVEHAGELFKNTSGPLALIKFVRNIIKHSKKGK